MSIIETETVVESPKTPRNFRTAIDIENFYRFVNDNDLRNNEMVLFCYLNHFQPNSHA